ncbi:Cytochrome c, class I [hydrothermal vent metagenome]|uniref:Cytochrome c, class I n=1 Tax=hydrothermal vent metagenome TaxID=652676 RepID=A0A1W1C5U2_9ZZZZ
MIRKEFLLAATLSALLLGGCFNSETGASQRAANGDVEKVEVKHEAPAKAEKAEAPATAEKAEAPAKEEKAEAPAKEEKAEAPAKEEKAEAPAKEEKAEAPAKEEKAEAPAKEEKAEAPAKEEKAEAPAKVNLTTCNGCHGATFEKKAMGVSKVVNTLSKDEIVTALKGYKAGTYGGAMKGVMKGQADKLDDATIEAIAGTIAKK